MNPPISLPNDIEPKAERIIFMEHAPALLLDLTQKFWASPVPAVHFLFRAYLFKLAAYNLGIMSLSDVPRWAWLVSSAGCAVVGFFLIKDDDDSHYFLGIAFILAGVAIGMIWLIFFRE